MVDSQNTELSIVQQCKLLKVSRSAVYYRPKKVRPLDLEQMTLKTLPLTA